ncbi:MAG TPA: hypothetical protein VF944_07415 [Candidatus Bathyarchaeia archaeon]
MTPNEQREWAASKLKGEIPPSRIEFALVLAELTNIKPDDTLKIVTDIRERVQEAFRALK